MTTKNWILCLMAITLFACTQGTKENSQQSYVEVVGYAEKEIDPDIFYLSITLSENTNPPKSNLSAMEQRMTGIMKSLSINTEKDLSVTGLSGDNWTWWRRGRTVYQSKSYSLKANNLDVLNQLCDKLDSMGYVSYYLTKTDYSKIEDLKKEVQQEAVKQARVKADNLLSGENQQVDKLIYLQEREIPTSNVNLRYNWAENTDKSANQMEYAANPINFKKLKVSYDVIARFSID